MCVIATKSHGYLLPNEETLRRCFTSNPDGAGFAWSNKDKVFWKKGFTTFNEFYAALKAVFPDETSERASACIMHFRIGTHGPKKSLSHTHPFPVDGADMQSLCALEGETQMALFHNGILYNMTKVVHEKVLVDGVSVDPSDSQIFTSKFVKPMFRGWKTKAFSTEDFNNMMLELIGTSKIALLMPKSAIARYGDWAKEDTDYPGCTFSNLSYKEYKVTKTYTQKSFTADDDFLWDDEGYYTGYKSAYWKAYDQFFRDNPGATIGEFNKAYDAHKLNQTTTEQKALPDNTVAPVYEPFHAGKRSSLAFVGATEGFQPLPLNTSIARTKASFVRYDPAIDGEVYYWRTSRGKARSVEGKDFLYLKTTVGNKDQFYYLGAYAIELPKGEPANVQETSTSEKAAR